jgi:hypothetical protein
VAHGAEVPRLVSARRVLLALLAMPQAAAEWLQPDPTYKDALVELRIAARDTAGHADDPARLDSLGTALLRLARFDDAMRAFDRSLELRPGGPAARAGLGKIALFRGRLEEAGRQLEGVGPDQPGAFADLYALRLRRQDWAAAAEMCAEVHQDGRAALLRAMAETPSYVLGDGPDRVTLQWVKAFPVPLVRVKLNGTSVLMGVDTGANDLLLDASFARRLKVLSQPAKHAQFWNGSRVVVGNAIVQRLDLGSIRLERVPAGVLSLRKYSLEVNPYSEPVAGIIGLGVLRRFTPTLDWEGRVLELRRPGVAYAPGPDALRVPFELWGENELTVYGSLAGGRRMALVVQTGLPGCGVAAPQDVFDEVGVKPGMFSKAAKGAGSWLQGRPWAAVTVSAVTVGPIAKDKVQGWSGALDSSELWRHGVRRDAVLGGDFFKGMRITIDWHAGELVVES